MARETQNRFTPQGVQVVELRRAERAARDADDAAEPDGGSERNYSCQWVVDGHWRNQPFGPNREQRRLQWINAYVKGPDGLPLKTHQARPKVFVVDR
jgi:hypothetical protein